MFEKSKERYKDGEYKILIAKIIDKYNFTKTKNKITYTDFLNMSEISIVKRILEEEKILNYQFYGVRNNADRMVLIFFPEKFSQDMVEKNYKTIFKIIRIKLPNNIKYEHREILSGIMKLGIKREKFGDIVITEEGADIIIFSDIANILLEDLKNLTRFKKANINIIDIEKISNKENEFEDFNIIVSSLRLDNFVSELSKCSRNQASELIKIGKVFLNSINEFKDSKKVMIKDIITIRGKGKFIFADIEKETKGGKLLINMKKYK